MPDNLKTYRTADGETYDVPSDKEQKFLSKYPKAIQIKSYVSGKDTIDVPIDKIDSFLNKNPKATPLQADQPQSAPQENKAASVMAQGVQQPKPANKSLDPSTTTNLNPHSSSTNPVTNGAQPTAYQQAEEDAALALKKEGLANDFYTAMGSNPDAAQNPDHLLSKEEKQKIDYKNVLDQTRNAFTSNPKYQNKNNREEYYNNIEKTMPLVDINSIRQQGEQSAELQNTYTAHKKIAEANPTSANISAYGMDQAKAGDLSTAEKTFGSVLKNNPDSPEGYQGMAYVSYLKKDLPSALNNIDQAILRSPNKGGLYTEKANYQWLSGQHEEALINANTAIDRSEFGTKDNFQAYYLRANMRHQLGNTTGATDDYDKAQESYKKYTGTFNWAYRNKELGVGATDDKAKKETFVNPYTGESVTATTEEKESIINDFNAFLKKHGEAPLNESQYNFPEVRNLINVFMREDNTQLHPPSGIFGKLSDPNIVSDYVSGAASAIDNGIKDMTSGVGGMIHMIDLSEAGKGYKPEDIVKSGLKNEIKAANGIAQTTGGIFSLTPEGALFNTGTAIAQQALPDKVGEFLTKPYEFFAGEQKEGSTGSDIAGVVDNAAMILGITALHKGLGSVSGIASGIKDIADQPYTTESIQETPTNIPAEAPPAPPVVKTEPLASDDAAKGMASQAAAMQDQKIQKAFTALGSNVKQMAVSSFINDKILNKQVLTADDQVKLSQMLRDNVSTGQAMQTAKALKDINDPYVKSIADKLTEYADQNRKFYEDINRIKDNLKEAQIPEDETIQTIQPRPKITDITKKDISATPVDVHTAVMQYFANGGKVSTEYLKGLVKSGTDQATLSDLHTENGDTYDKIAEKVSERLDRSDNPVSEEEVRDAINSTLSEATGGRKGKSRDEIVKNLKQRILENKQAEYDKQISPETNIYKAKNAGTTTYFEDKDGNRITKQNDPSLYATLSKSIADKPQVPTEIHVTPWIKDTPNGKEIGNVPFGDLKQARGVGKVEVEGKKYERQDKLKGEDKIKGKNTEIWFDNTEPKKGHYALVDINKIQPAFDKEGMPNHNSFIPESKPRNRDIEAINPTPADFDTFSPEIVGVDQTAYMGAPVLNERGEVIQGHHRANELKQYLSGLGDPNGYYEHLKSLSEETGISEKDIEANPNKALVRILIEGDDNNHIEIGQKTSRDMNGVTPLDLAINNLKDITPDQARGLTKLWGNERGLDDFLAHKGDPFSKWLANEGLLKPTDANTLMTPDQQDLNQYGINRSAALLRGILFRGAHEGIKDSFEELPRDLQKAIENTIPVILRMGDAAPLSEIQTAIQAQGDFLEQTNTRDPEQLKIEAQKFLNNYGDLVTDRDKAMITAMTGITGPYDMAESLDMMHYSIKGNELQGLKPMSPQDAYDNIFGSTGKTTGPETTLNQQNSLYGKGREETRTQANISPENSPNQTEPRGNETGQGNGTTTGDTGGKKSGAEIADSYFNAPLEEIQQLGFKSAIDHTSLANKSGILGDLYRATINRPLKIALDEIDSQRNKNKGLLNTQWARVREGYDALTKEYPELNDKESHEAVWDVFDKNRNDPGYNVDQAGLTNAQKQLYDFTVSLKKYALDVIQKAKVDGLVTDDYVNMVQETISGYLPRIAKDYANDINEKVKKMEAKTANRALFEAKEKAPNGYLHDIIAQYEDSKKKKGMGSEKLSDFSHTQKYWHAVKVADKNGTRLIDRGNPTVVYFNDKTGSISRFENPNTKEPAYFGRFGGTAEEVKSEKDIVNPTIDKVIRDGKMRDALGNYYELHQASTSEITKYTGQEYIKNPVYAAAKLLEGATNTYTGNLLYKIIKSDPKFDQYRRILNPAGQQLAEEMSNIPEVNVDLRRQKMEEFNKKKNPADRLPDNFFTDYRLPEEGVFPKSFDNVYIRKDAYNSLKNAMVVEPQNAEAATRGFLSLVLYPKLVGLRHFYNVSSDYIRNSVNLENLGQTIKDAKEKKAFTDLRLAHDQVINGGEFAKMMANEGFNTMFRGKDDKMEFMNGVIEQEMAQDTKFHEAIQTLVGKQDFKRALITQEGDINKAIATSTANMLKKVSKATTWYGTDLFNYAQVIKEMRLGGLKVPKEGLDAINWNDPANKQMMRDAVKRVEPRLVTYKVKTFVGMPNEFGRILSKGLRNKAVTVFGGYDIGIMKVLLNDVKNLSKAGIKQGGFTEVGAGNREAFNSAQRLAMTGLMMYGFHKLYQAVNQDDENKVTKFSVPGTAGLANRTYNYLKGDMDFGDYAKSLFHLSPVITDPVDIIQNNNYNNQPIYSRTWAGNNWSNTKDILSYLMLNGTNVAQLRTHLTDGEWKQAGEDAEKMVLPISKSKYTPSETEVIKNLFNYKDFFESRVKQFQNDINNASTDNAKSRAQQQMIDQVYKSETSLLDQTIHFTENKIADIKAGVISPLDKTQDEPLQFYTDFLQQMKDQRDSVDAQFKDSTLDPTEMHALFDDIASAYISHKE